MKPNRSVRLRLKCRNEAKLRCKSIESKICRITLFVLANFRSKISSQLIRPLILNENSMKILEGTIKSFYMKYIFRTRQFHIVKQWKCKLECIGYIYLLFTKLLREHLFLVAESINYWINYNVIVGCFRVLKSLLKARFLIYAFLFRCWSNYTLCFSSMPVN